jgi:hypothetical protein
MTSSYSKVGVIAGMTLMAVANRSLRKEVERRVRSERGMAAGVVLRSICDAQPWPDPD